MAGVFRDIARRVRETGRSAGRTGPIVRTLGPASLAFPLVGATVVDGVAVLVSRNLTPTRLALLDLASGAVVDEVHIPHGNGSWGVAADGAGGLYLGQFGAQGADNLFHLDVGERRLQPLAAFDSVYIWDLAVAADGVLLGVRDQPPGAFTRDPASGEITSLPAEAAGEGDVPRAVAWAGDAVIIGGSRERRAFLRAVDRSSHAVRDVLPPELAQDGIVYSLAGDGRVVALGTRGPEERNPAVALLDAADLSVRHVARIDGESVIDALAITDDAVLLTTRPSGAVHRLDRETGEVRRLAQPVPFDEQRAIVVLDGAAMGASASGAVWELDLDTGDVEVTDLVGDGLLDGSPEQAQSLAAHGGRVWGGGTFGFSERSGQRMTRHRVPGEPKDFALAGGDLYMGVYPVGQLWRLGEGDDEPSMVEQLPAEQNRPLALHHDADRDWILVGTAADRAGGGSLHIHDRAGGEGRTHRNPIDERQRVMSIATLDGIAYLGGTVDGTIVAWDLDTGAQAWRLPPQADAGSVRGLATSGGRMYAFTTAGWFCAIDPATRSFVHRERATPAGGGLVAVGDHLYGVDGDHLYRFDPGTFAVDTVLGDLGSVLWGHPFLAADEQGRLYVLRGTDVVQVAVEA